MGSGTTNSTFKSSYVRGPSPSFVQWRSIKPALLGEVIVTNNKHSGPGNTIGGFRLLEKVGFGAFGTVWSATDLELQRTVAIKFPRGGYFNQEVTEKLIHEARVAARLNHPNLVKVLEVGRHQDDVYIVSEFVEGLDLASWLSENATTPHEAATLCASVADALAHAHNHDVIHRDLKPSNIMLDNEGTPHLLDFGLAKRSPTEITMTTQGKLLGTPAYMSPEQARGAAHEADARTDIYSLGIILLELLTGARPFRGSTQMLVHQIVIEDAPSPRKLNGHMSRDLDTICLKCLEKDPHRRYPSAEQLRDDLRRFLHGKPVQARPVGQGVRAVRWCKRNPLPAVLAAGLSLALVVGVTGITSFWLRAEEQAELRRRLLYTSEIGRAQRALDESNVRLCRDLLDRHIPVTGRRT